MSVLKTSVEIQDRVSGALNRITAALYTTTSAFQGVDRASDVAFNPSGVQAMAQAMYGYEQKIEQLEADLVNANNRLKKMEEHTKRVSQTADTLKKAFGAAFGVMGVGKILQTSDELVQTTSRINMMNDGLQTTPELMNMIYRSAQNARGGFTKMADVVARFGNNAGDAFGSSEEVVAFAELVQKQMTIAGASTAEASNAMLQLSQGLGSGVLRGDELNSIFEQAPNLIQNIADYLNVPIGEIREMASEGELTADIVKNAIFSATDEINANFENMPMTWGQIWQSMQNTALMKFQPVLQKINEIANSDDFRELVNGVAASMVTIANIVLNIFELVGAVGSFVQDNWAIIGPLVYGVATALALYATYLGITNGLELISNGIKIASCVASYAHAAATGTQASATAAATAAQYGLNTALLSSPVTWIVLAVIALIAVLIAVCNWIAKTTGVANSGIGVIMGALAAAVAFIWNLFLGLVDLVLGIVNYWYNIFGSFVNFFANVFNDPIGSIIQLFGNLADNVLGVIETIAGALDKVFGTNLADTVSGWRANLSSKVEIATKEYGNGTYEEVMGDIHLTSESLGLGRWAYGDAFSAGAAFGDSLAEKFGGTDTSEFDSAYTTTGTGSVVDCLSSIAGDTSDLKDSVDITDENLKYLRDVAERDVVNRFTTAEIKVDMQNNNNISSNMDIDGLVSQLSLGVQEAMEQAAEGVHS